MRKDITYSWLVILFIGIIAGAAGAIRQLLTPVVVCKDFHFEKTAYLTPDKQDSLFVSFDYAYPVAVKGNPKSNTCRSIQQSVCRTVFGEAFTEMRPQQALEAYAALKHTEYIQNNFPILQEWQMDSQEHPETMFNEELIIHASPVGIGRGILSYGMDVYEYTGGAHGNNYLLIQNYDLHTGNTIEEQDLFIDDYYEPLHRLLVAALIAQTDEAASEKDLRRLGYSVPDIVPNENFFLSEQGITYVYNPYEIAPYALGRIQILLSYDTLTTLMR